MTRYSCRYRSRRYVLKCNGELIGIFPTLGALIEGRNRHHEMRC